MNAAYEGSISVCLRAVDQACLRAAIYLRGSVSGSLHAAKHTCVTCRTTCSIRCRPCMFNTVCGAKTTLQTAATAY